MYSQNFKVKYILIQSSNAYKNYCNNIYEYVYLRDSLLVSLLNNALVLFSLRMASLVTIVKSIV